MITAFNLVQWLYSSVDTAQGAHVKVDPLVKPTHLSDLLLPNGEPNPAAPEIIVQRIEVEIEGPGRVTKYAYIKFGFDVAESQDCTAEYNMIKRHLRSWLKAWLL